MIEETKVKKRKLTKDDQYDSEKRVKSDLNEENVKHVSFKQDRHQHEYMDTDKFEQEDGDDNEVGQNGRPVPEEDVEEEVISFKKAFSVKTFRQTIQEKFNILG